MDAIRQLLSHQSIECKSLIMKLYILAFISLSIFGILFLHSQLVYQQLSSSNNNYQNALTLYTEKYQQDQQAYRKFLFYQTYDQIVLKNKTQLNKQYLKGIDQFSSLSEKQFQELFKIVTNVANQKKFLEIAQFQYDATYDWSIYMPPLKNSRGYNSGHIFAIVSAIEFEINKYRQQNDPWITLSQQQIIDCCPECISKNTSNPVVAVYNYIAQYGLTTDKQYPYVNSIASKSPKKCQVQGKGKQKYSIKTYQKIKYCTGINEQITKHPVVVGVDARSWLGYKYGIMRQCERKITHHALLAGRGIGFWKLRNNWGSKWGERGYIRIGPQDTCGVCLDVTRPIFE